MRSLAGGLAASAGMLVGARLGQGAGAAMMASAGLSILTTSFNSGGDRITHVDLGRHQRTFGRSPPVNDNQENQMKFLLQVRFNGAGTVIGGLSAQEQEEVTAEFEAIRRSPGVLDGNRLQAAGTAATVRMDGGQARVTKGPAVEAGSELDGYYVYDAPGLDAAAAFAARIPVTRFGGTVEVRPMVER